MKSQILAACLAGLVLFTSAAVSSNSTAAATNALSVVSTNAYPLKIVTCREDVDVEALLAEFQITLQSPKHKMRALKMFAALLDDALIQRLQADPRVEAVEADGPVSLCGQGKPFGIIRIGIPAFPVARISGAPEPLDVDVAILDSGIEPHEDLNVFTNHTVFDDELYTEFPHDNYGHGTAVAGVLGALDNGIGIVGVAPGVRIWNVQCWGPPPLNAWINFVQGVEYVLQNADKISVVNISLSNEACAPITAIRGATRNLVRAGIVVVAGAGNFTNDVAGPDHIYGTCDDALPASSPYSMAVSGMDASIYAPGGVPRDQFYAFSQYSQAPRTSDSNPIWATNFVISPGGAIDVAAPAVNIVTTLGDETGTNYGFFGSGSGTSFAAPHVAGLVALYIAANGRAPLGDPSGNQATNLAPLGVFRIRQAIVDASLPQSQWHTNNTLDPDTNPEPLAIASENWVTKPLITSVAGAPGNFSVGFATIPGYDYTVQSATNLTPPIAWENLRTVSSSSNVTPASVTDTNAASQRFYQIARNPSGPAGEPPHIIAQPASNWITPSGTTAILTVAVSGIPPVGYFWQKNGSTLTDGGNVSGAATASLVLTNLQPTDAGAYTAVITNVFGSTTSAVATITILTNWSSALVTGVLATATSELGNYNRFASQAVDGVHADPTPWESVGVNQGFGEDRRPAITFDLGAVRPLENTVVWNGSEQPVSIKRMTIEVSNDGVSFSSLGEFTLTTQSPASEALALGGVVCRYVRFTIRENGAGQLFPVTNNTPLGGGYAEIDEVEFHAYRGN